MKVKQTVTNKTTRFANTNEGISTISLRHHHIF